MDRPTIKRMRAWGASDEVLADAEEQLAEQEQVGDFEVWPDNWDTWSFFLKVCAMWERTGMDGRRTWLAWPALEVVARGLGLKGKAWGEVVEALLLVQDAVLAVDAERAANKG